MIGPPVDRDPVDRDPGDRGPCPAALQALVLLAKSEMNFFFLI